MRPKAIWLKKYMGVMLGKVKVWFMICRIDNNKSAEAGIWKQRYINNRIFTMTERRYLLWNKSRNLALGSF